MYEKGRGVSQDYVQARQWYEKAAAQGDVNALYNLAGANGNKNAATLRDALAILMTPAQIDEAQKLVREWQTKTP